VFKLVLGNKTDLNKEREVSQEDISEFERKTGIDVFEVSAKNGNQVDNAFREIVEKLISKK
jgi:putative ribosome biogenesis GTPase RsgA